MMYICSKFKNGFIIVASFAFSFIWVSCASDCARTDCGYSIPAIFSFRVLNNSGKDLLTGPFKQYDTSKILIIAKRVSNSNIEPIKRNFIAVSDTNFVTSFGVSSDYSSYYISINNNITDSFSFKYNRKEIDCCDMSYYSLINVNSSPVTPPISLPFHNYQLIK